MSQAAYRIIDANLNRAREAARVVEEYFRFILNDAQMCEACKSLRHRIQEATSHLDRTELVAARNNIDDVGTRITLDSEASRQDLRAVIDANLARLTEALRTLEEYGKTLSAPFAAAIEALRYETYRIEAALPHRQHLVNLREAKVMVILGGHCRLPAEKIVDQLVAAGQRVFQVREKAATDAEALRACERWMLALHQHDDLTVVMNDRVDFALALGADGVHLGQDDMLIAQAQTLLGPARVVGLSTHNLAEIHEAEAAGADYLGAGAIFPTDTKAVSQLGGLAWGSQATKAANAAKLPAFCIGGINPSNIAAVAEAGIERVAVASALMLAEDPTATLKMLIAALT